MFYVYNMKNFLYYNIGFYLGNIRKQFSIMMFQQQQYI